MRPTLLMILDGYGMSEDKHGNAVHAAHTPNLDKLYKNYPHTTLNSSGAAVGLPDGQMGNSEVGHLNIGAGRIVYQELTRISKSIQDGDFFDNVALVDEINNVKKNDSSLHLMGLLSDGGVHSHETHLYALLELAKKKGLKKVYIHAFLDGRDVPPRSALEYIDRLENKIHEIGVGEIASITGRYYAMDRDKRWERVEKAYDALTLGEGLGALTAKEAVENAYARDENDEFVQPTIVGEKKIINNNDSIIFFNFRPDRAREITRAFVDDDFYGFVREKRIKDFDFICMTGYDATMPNVAVAYPPTRLKNTFGEYISSLGLKQLRIAETEKYAHVTFFFNGGVEKENKDEDRILVPSPKVDTYDLQPEMSAYEITNDVMEAIDSGKYDVIVLNYANLDMVGHTGVFEAAVKAVETIDDCVGKVVSKVLDMNGQMLLTADHGNSECMLTKDGEVVTAHSTNVVPLICIKKDAPKLKHGALSDIAPTMLDLMKIEKPTEMTGESLITR